MWEILTEYEEGFTQLLVKIDQIQQSHRDQPKAVYIRNTQYAQEFSPAVDRPQCSISVISDGKLTTKQQVYKAPAMDIYEFVTSGFSTLPYTGCERSDPTMTLQLHRDHQGYILAPQCLLEEEGAGVNDVILCTPFTSPVKLKEEQPVEIIIPSPEHNHTSSSQLSASTKITTTGHADTEDTSLFLNSPAPTENEQVHSSFQARKAILTSSPVYSTTEDIFSEHELVNGSSPVKDASPSPGKLRNQSECSIESHDSGYENSDVDDRSSSLITSPNRSHGIPDCLDGIIYEEGSTSDCKSSAKANHALDISTEKKSLNFTNDCEISDIYCISMKHEKDDCIKSQATDNDGTVSQISAVNNCDISAQCCELTDNVKTIQEQAVLSEIGQENDDATCISRGQVRSLAKCKDRQLVEIDRRKAELHAQVDRWHGYLTKHINTAYEEEETRLQREDERVYEVVGVKSPTKKMCSLINTRNRVSFHDFGTFSSKVVVDMHSEAVQGYQMIPANHIRTFESRDHKVETDYMATGLSYSLSTGNFTVTDMGADTCRIFSDEGRLLSDLDLEPLEEPSQAVPAPDGGTVLACSKGLKYYDSTGQFSHFLAEGDIKCPQSVAIDNTGCYIISDMHDCGSMIVNLEGKSLLPLRIFSGSQYDTYPQCFSKAWYIHVRKDGSVILSDREEHTVKAFDAHGRFLWNAGGIGAKTGQFFTPAGITEDRLGNLLVADSGNDRVQILSSAGDWLGVVVTGEDHGIKTPMDVAVDSKGQLAVLQASGTMSLYTYLHTVS